VKSREASGHFGLVGMRERAELSGGSLKVESDKGKGTRVVLTI
jgi:signal transduction histidine kinase